VKYEFFIRRPLVGLAAAYAVGTSCGLFSPEWILVFVLVGMASGVGAILLYRRMGGLIFVYAAVACAAGAAAAANAGVVSPLDLGRRVSAGREYVRLTGVVGGDPVQAGRRAENGGVWRFPFRVDGFDRDGSLMRAAGVVRVYLRQDEEGGRPRYGDRMELSGVLTAGEGAAPLRRYTMRVGRGQYRRLAGGHGNFLVEACLRGRRHCAEILGMGIEGEGVEAGLLRALLLGYRDALPERVRRDFALTGTLHIFAISGLHVGMIAALAVGMLRAFGLSRRWWIAGLAPILLVYTLATGMKASAVRACIMALLFFSAPLFGRRPDGPSALAAAALLILLFAPRQILEPGFQMSFAVVAGIMLFLPWAGRVGSLVPVEEPWSAGGSGVARRALYRAAAGVVGLGCISLAAWLFSAPLTAYYFNTFSPAAAVGNILVVPGAFLVVFTGCLALVAGFAVPPLAGVFNNANVVFAGLLLKVVELLGKVPWGHMYVRAPPVWFLLVWYGSILAIVTGKRRMRRAAVTGLAASAVVLSLIGTRGTASVTVFDGGDTLPVLIDLPGTADVLVDSGRGPSTRRILRELHRRGCNRLRVFVVSRPISACMGGAVELLQRMKVDEIWYAASAVSSRTFDLFLAEARRRDVKVRYAHSGMQGQWPGGVWWEILAPRKGVTSRRAGAAALVLRLERGGAAVMLAGAAPPRLLQGLSATGKISGRREVVLVRYMNESPGPREAAFLRAYRPSLIVNGGIGYPRRWLQAAGLRYGWWGSYRQGRPEGNCIVEVRGDDVVELVFPRGGGRFTCRLR